MVALQIRDVPVEVRDELAAAAAERGISLQFLLMEVIQRAADSTHNRRLVREWQEQPLLAPGVEVDIVRIIADGREEREARIREIFDLPAPDDHR